MANPTYPRFNTQVALMSGIPWDKSYKHMRKFSSIEERNAYILSKQKFSVGDISYIRPFDPTPIRVEFNQEELASCNYMMFHNDVSFWYFAFITDISYLADGTSEIRFELDWWTTYQFQLHIKPCMVEREHVSNDAIGTHTYPEGIEKGPYIVANETFNDLEGMRIFMLASQRVDGTHFSGVINNVFTNLVILTGDLATIQGYIDNYISAGLQESIITIFMGPKIAVDPSSEAANYQMIRPNRSSIQGYVPKNKKLFVYPYIYLTVTNNNGLSNDYKYELWQQTEDPAGGNAGFKFHLDSTYITMPEALAIPISYKGYQENYAESLSCNSFPQCGFAGDTFRTWWAQNKTSFIYNTGKGAASGVIGTIANAVTGNVQGAINSAVSAVDSVASSAIEYERQQGLPDSFRGTAQSGSVTAKNNKIGFDFMEMSITAEYARKIDDYFTMFGYKIMRLKLPDLTSRQSWNYVKTIGAEVYGDCPEWVIERMIQRLDAGCWFWHTNDVGNFGLNNPIVEVG